jgi:thiol:disulfide interchange protein
MKKKLDRLLQAIILALSIYLLFRFYGDEKFTRLDYVWIVILALAGFITIIKEVKRKRKEN